MNGMFYTSILSSDLSNWKPYNIKEWAGTFIKSNIAKPYWYRHDDPNMAQLIDTYHLHKEINAELNNQSAFKKKVKI
jgi:hypothetical protein